MNQITLGELLPQMEAQATRMSVKADLVAYVRDRIAVDASGCWLWTGAIDRHGYGLVRLGGKSRLAHRVVYEAVGSIPTGRDLDHLCRVRACVNPAHLEPVTRAENLRRSPLVGKRKRLKTHCKHGHPMADPNLYVDPSGERHCRACWIWNGSRQAARMRAKGRH